MIIKNTEAALEARMHAVMKDSFPWLPSESLKHQTYFSVKLGHTSVKVDGSSADRLTGRSDILVLLSGKPIALLELKREDISLTKDDVEQGLSYARLTTPSMPPLVIVSNGKDTQIYISYSGEKWEPVEQTEIELHRRINDVGKLAASDLKNAVCTLMGADQRNWIEALQSISKQLIEDRTGEWPESTPFVHNFMIPRLATSQVVKAMNDGIRVIVVHGPPLSGKSNVLRELVEVAQKNSASDSVLMIEPSEAGIFEAMAHLLSSELNWAVSGDDAREWLRTISNAKDTKLVLALDGVDPAFPLVLADLNELASYRFGASLHIVITVDDSALGSITKKPNGREKNALGRLAHNIQLLPLDDIEFKDAQKVLAQNRILVTAGGEAVLSLREPWILRALVPADVAELLSEELHLCVKIPPLMDIEAIHLAAESIDLDEVTEATLRLAASAILDQYLESKNVEAILHGISTFAVDMTRLEHAIGDTGIRLLRQCGYIKSGINWAEQPVWFVRAPTLLANHLATVLSIRLQNCGEPEEVANRLITVATKLPLGDIIAASALVQNITRRIYRNPLDILSALFSRSPQASPLHPGSKFCIAIAGGVLQATVKTHGRLSISTDTSTIEIEMEPDDIVDAIIDLGGWLILSHIAALPLGIDIPEESEVARLDEPLLTELAQAKIVLSRPDGNQDFKGIAVHDIPGHGSIVCHQAGIVEPITWAIVKYFIRRGAEATLWIEESIAKQSLPLLTRIHIALRQITGLSDARGDWAREVLAKHIEPAISASLMHH